MPQDLSHELNLIYWESWFLDQLRQTPVGTDSWGCHSADSLEMYNAGGEL
jgi:hypothetical protein